jgi:hypothetical protein
MGLAGLLHQQVDTDLDDASYLLANIPMPTLVTNQPLPKKKNQ